MTFSRLETEAVTEEDGAQSCVICLENITDPCVAQPCAHAHFDFVCLANWLQRNTTCPLCKCPITSVRYGQEANKCSVYKVPADGEVTSRPTAAGPGQSSDPSTRRPWHRRQPAYGPRGAFRRPPPPSADEAMMRRRRVYRQQLYSLHVGSNPYSRYRDPTPAQLAATPHLITRARMWIRRELGAFAFLRDDDAGECDSSSARRRRRTDNAEFLVEYIVAIIKTVDVKGSAGAAEDMLADFLGREHARLFLHELRSWLRSPHGTLEAWDREVQYPDPSLFSVSSTRRRRLGAIERASEVRA